MKPPTLFVHRVNMRIESDAAGRLVWEMLAHLATQSSVESTDGLLAHILVRVLRVAGQHLRLALCIPPGGDIWNAQQCSLHSKQD
jgi:hypothetical protein